MKRVFGSMLLAGLFFFTSCSPKLSPFSQRLIDQNGWSEDELQQIQFYLSDDIVLKRDFTRGSSEIVSGDMKMVNGREVEQVRIAKGTPGILLFQPKSTRMAVSFESGSDKRYLMFGPNPKRGKNYVLLASDWKNRRGKVRYDGKTYYTDPNSALATLMVDLKKSGRTSVKSRSAKGRKIK
ncbi:MAG: hypothetical protein AAGJ18_14850 [Bacteroidota bacterium]